MSPHQKTQYGVLLNKLLAYQRYRILGVVVPIMCLVAQSSDGGWSLE